MSDAQAHTMSYNYVELAALLADGKMVRDHYVGVRNPNAIAAWAERFDRTDVFASFTRLQAQARSREEE